MMPLSQLQLKGHFFPLINLKANRAGTANGRLSMEQSLNFAPSKTEANTWELEIKLASKSTDPERPHFYELEVHAVGVFEAREIESSRQEMFVAVNGLSILYGAIRELALTLTSRSRFGPFCLPGLNFAAIVEQHKREKEEKAPA